MRSPMLAAQHSQVPATPVITAPLSKSGIWAHMGKRERQFPAAWLLGRGF
jgi:hypothetical protein